MPSFLPRGDGDSGCYDHIKAHSLMAIFLSSVAIAYRLAVRVADKLLGAVDDVVHRRLYTFWWLSRDGARRGS